MAHIFVFIEETEDDHVFACSKCGQVIGFNKPGIGEPNADTSGPTPLPPVDTEKYIDPCTE